MYKYSVYGFVGLHLLLWLANLVRTSLALDGAPKVQIQLQANWPSPPYILEILEGVHVHNSSAFWPLLKQVISLDFASLKPDAVLQFALDVIKQDTLLSPTTLDLFLLGLALHETQPLIHAQYQWYEAQHLHSTCPQAMAFDHIFGYGEEKLMYVDLVNSADATHLATAVQNPAKQKTRLRWKPSLAYSTAPPSTLSGYGARLDLKRTDYMVIDDRDLMHDITTDSTSLKSPNETSDGDDLFLDHHSDLRPLTASQLESLGLKASQYLVDSTDPFSTLVKLSGHFPKYAHSIAAYKIDEQLRTDILKSHQVAFHAGHNAVWINGQAVDPRDMNPFRLLGLLQKEVDLVEKMKSYGMSGAEAIDLLAPSKPGETAGETDNSFDGFLDVRDEEEANAIIWLNDVARDLEYQHFTPHLTDILRPTYPGSLHNIRLNLWNAVFAVNLEDFAVFKAVLQPALQLMRRQIPIRFGFVPLIKAESDLSHITALIMFHLREQIGKPGLTDLIGLITQGDSISLKVLETAYQKVLSKHGFRSKTPMLAFTELIARDESRTFVMEDQLASAKAWVRRIRPNGSALADLYFNGHHTLVGEDWTRTMMQQIQYQMPIIQEAVYTRALTSKTDILSWILEQPGVLKRGSGLLAPTESRPLKFVDIEEIVRPHRVGRRPICWLYPEKDTTSLSTSVSITIIADLDSHRGVALVQDALAVLSERTDTRLSILDISLQGSGKLASMLQALETDLGQLEILPMDLLRVLEANKDNSSQTPTTESEATSADESMRESDTNLLAKDVREKLQLYAVNASALVINGRFIGPIDPSEAPEGPDLIALLNYEVRNRIGKTATALERQETNGMIFRGAHRANLIDKISPLLAQAKIGDDQNPFRSASRERTRLFESWPASSATFGNNKAEDAVLEVIAIIDPLSEEAQKWSSILDSLSKLERCLVQVFLNPVTKLTELPIKRFYQYSIAPRPGFRDNGTVGPPLITFRNLPEGPLYSLELEAPPAWLTKPVRSIYDLDNIRLSDVPIGARGQGVEAIFQLRNIIVEGHAIEGQRPPRGAQMTLGQVGTIVMSNLGYLQFASNPGVYQLSLREGRSSEVFMIDTIDGKNASDVCLAVNSFNGVTMFPRLKRKPGQAEADVLSVSSNGTTGVFNRVLSSVKGNVVSMLAPAEKMGSAEINIFSVASGHLYERFLGIMTQSVMRHTKHSVKFWFIENFLSPSFIEFLPYLAKEYNFQYELITYKWPHWLRAQKEKQRVIWGYKILFLDVLFPLNLDKVIFVDADQIVRTDLKELIDLDLKGAPYGYTPMCDSRTEMDGFRFWKSGYWKDFLGDLPYHISALYVIDLRVFRQLAAGDQLRGQYQSLTADPGSLANLDQDLPNNLQHSVPIFSLPQEWLWCETWCDDESLKTAKTIDLCNNPLTHESKLKRAKRQIPEWTEYDDNIAKLNARLAAARRLSSQGMNSNASAVQVALDNDPLEAVSPSESPRADPGVSENTSDKSVHDEL